MSRQPAAPSAFPCSRYMTSTRPGKRFFGFGGVDGSFFREKNPDSRSSEILPKVSCERSETEIVRSSPLSRIRHQILAPLSRNSGISRRSVKDRSKTDPALFLAALFFFLEDVNSPPTQDSPVAAITISGHTPSLFTCSQCLGSSAPPKPRPCTDTIGRSRRRWAELSR